MIDSIQSYSHIQSRFIPLEVKRHIPEPFIFKGLDFIPCYSKSNAEVIYYDATTESKNRKGVGNLSIRITDGVAANFNVSNSLHKVWNNGHNDNDFCYSDLSDCIGLVSDSLDMRFDDFKLRGRLEYGLNFQHIKEVYKDQIQFKHIRPNLMLKNNKQIGTRFNLTSYTVKTYNKSIQSENPILKKQGIKILDQVQRFEVVSKIYHLKRQGIHLHTISDLKSYDNLLLLKDSIQDISKNILMKPDIPSNSTYKDLQVYFFFQNATKDQLDHFRKENSKTYKRHLKQYKEFLKNHVNSSMDLSQILTDKFTQLIYN